jgi:hypothetical protein
MNVVGFSRELQKRTAPVSQDVSEVRVQERQDLPVDDLAPVFRYKN